MLNKTEGVVSATEDGRYRTVIDLIDEAKRKDLFRSDASILIRKDCFSSRTTVRWRMSFWHRKNTWIRSILRVKGTLKEGIEARFQAGLTLKDGTPVRPAELVIEKKWNDAGEDLCEARLTIHEGKFHQVKRMFEAEGGEVDLPETPFDGTACPG